MTVLVLVAAGCQFKEPFVGSVNVTTVDGKRVKAGIFRKTVPISAALPDGG